MDAGGSTSRLTTVDAEGRRLWVYPSDVSGRYRTRRNWTSAGLLLFFLALPWLRIGGHQALLLDFASGRFSIFGLRFWSHDAPMLLFVLGGAAVTLAFVTSVWGRVWCGWACPQTVFVDSVFRRIERWIEGNSLVRKRRDAGPMTGEKLFKKTLKWSCYVAISLVLSHSFLAYFIGTEALARMMAHPPTANPGSFLAMAGITAAVLFDFGWLREQFCTLICPYGRFQSVLMDERSLAIVYDKTRPDCIDCGRCVQVCPTGIDIRNGLQLECVACTACADACDAVMTKIKKPTGLVRYASGWGGKRLGNYARPAGWFAALLLLTSALAFTMSRREPVEMTLIRAVGSPFQEVVRQDQTREIVNHFHLDLLNQSFEPARLETITEADSDPSLPKIQIVSAALPLELAPGEARRVDLFIRFPLSRLEGGRAKIRLALLTKIQEVPLVGPLR